MSLARTVSGSVTRSAAQFHANRFNPRLHDANLTLLYQFDKYKSLAATDGLGPILGITRTTIATYFDASGVLQTAATGIPRFDHNPATGESLGLLVEEARTNLCLRSEDFTHAAWNETNTDQPTTNNTAPDGTAAADEIAATSTADQAFAIYQAFTGRTAAESTTISCFLKAGTNATFAQLAYDAEGGGSDGFFCNFKLSDGTKGSVTAFAAGTATSSAIEDVGNGWYRCTIVGKIAVGTVARFTVAITDIITAAGFEAANLADNDSIIAWGADIEIGAFPTSYIPTVGSSVTRNQDIVKTTDVSWYNVLGGTLYMKASEPHVTGLDTFTLDLSDNSASDRILFQRPSTDDQVFLTIGTGNDASLSITNSWDTANTTVGTAAAFVANDAELYVNGARSGTGDQTVVIPTGISDLDIGSGYDDANPFSGHISELRYYNVRKDNQFLASLSSGLINA